MAKAFYLPDPALSSWEKKDKKLKKKGIPKSARPQKPPKNDNYPTKQEMALVLLKDFKHCHPSLKVKVILADALYGTADFMDKASALFGGIQVISQIRCNQNIHYQGKSSHVETFFDHYATVPQKLLIRGGKEVIVQVGSARLYVEALKTKTFCHWP